MIQSICKPQRCYIGSSINIKTRKSNHICCLRRNSHPSIKLQNHYNKYGESDLVFSILSGCDPDDLIQQEQFYIDAYNPWFNMRPKAGNNIGLKLSEDAKQKIREAHRGRKWPEEVKRKISESGKGRHWKLSKRRIRESMKGKNHSEETKLKMSESMRGIKKKIPWTDERKRKQGERMKGHKCSEETRRKMSEEIRRALELKRLKVA